MLGTRIIFVDGLPGSGKSTMADYVASVLEQRAVPMPLTARAGARSLPEGRRRPLPVRRHDGDPDVAAYTVRSFVEESPARWSAFVAEARSSERVNVLDSYPFQNSVRVLSQMDADPITLAAYQTSVRETAARLDPVLIYLDSGDAECALRAIAGQRGPAWTDYVIAVVTECPYGSSCGLRGMDGAVAIMGGYKHLLDESVARFAFPKLALFRLRSPLAGLSHEDPRIS